MSTNLISNFPERYIQNDLRPTLVGLSREGLAELLARIGVPDKQRRMRARQLWHWIYQRGVIDFAAMTEFLDFKRLRIRVGTSDLRIAAIAKANGIKLLTRNLRDFRLVPGLDAEDWAI